MSNKIYFIVLCGIADRPVPALDHKTPLEYATTPNLDRMARDGIQGLITIIDAEITPESDSGAMALLGYDPLIFYTGRGALEGLGSGFLDRDRNGVGFRINFASYDERRGVLDRRTSRDLTDDELATLVDEIRDRVRLDDEDVRFDICGFGRHRGIVCFRSDFLALSGQVSNTDPGFRKVGAFGIPNSGYQPSPLPCIPLDDSAASSNTAALVNKFVDRTSSILRQSHVNRRRIADGKSPANLLLFRDGGHLAPSLPAFRERFDRGLSIYGQVPAERGLSRLLGGRWVQAAAEGEHDEIRFYRDLARTLPTDPAEVVFVHIKGPDEPGHDGRPMEKVRAIERIDAVFFHDFLKRVRPGDAVVVTADHATPCEMGIHSADPVPALLCGAAIEPDSTDAFSELAASKGRMPARRGVDVMPMVIGMLADNPCLA
jgi:2,3-bisphosphoglycerate-independent phosphoglycerate mutase